MLDQPIFRLILHHRNLFGRQNPPPTINFSAMDMIGVEVGVWIESIAGNGKRELPQDGLLSPRSWRRDATTTASTRHRGAGFQTSELLTSGSTRFFWCLDEGKKWVVCSRISTHSGLGRPAPGSLQPGCRFTALLAAGRHHHRLPACDDSREVLHF